MLLYVEASCFWFAGAIHNLRTNQIEPRGSHPEREREGGRFEGRKGGKKDEGKSTAHSLLLLQILVIPPYSFENSSPLLKPDPVSPFSPSPSHPCPLPSFPAQPLVRGAF